MPHGAANGALIADRKNADYRYPSLHDSHAIVWPKTATGELRGCRLYARQKCLHQTVK